MSEPFIGEIRAFGFNFAPTGWAMCNGQLMQIALNQALFSLLGTTYGGDGRTNFALPDLQGRVGMHMNVATGAHPLGEHAGEETHTLSITEMPVHDHGIGGGGDQDTNRPGGAVAARGGVYAHTSTVSMAPTDPSGGSQRHNNLQPYLVLNYCIALVGIFPSRN
jgi:microcystin-dependent protein